MGWDASEYGRLGAERDFWFNSHNILQGVAEDGRVSSFNYHTVTQKKYFHSFKKDFPKLEEYFNDFSISTFLFKFKYCYYQT